MNILEKEKILFNTNSIIQNFNLLSFISSRKLKSKLEIASGKVYVGDTPDAWINELPYEFPNGRFSIILSEHFQPHVPEREILGIKVIFSSEKTSHWESALGQNDENIDFGVAIDSAMLFISDFPFAKEIANEISSQESGFEEFHRIAQSQLKYEIRREAKDGNMFSFSTQDDGGYPVYIGFDNKKSITELFIPIHVPNKSKLFLGDNKTPFLPENPSDAEIFKWIDAISKPRGEYVINNKPSDFSIIKNIFGELDEINIPSDILSYYKHCSPWEEGMTDVTLFWKKITKPPQAIHNFKFKYYLPLLLRKDKESIFIGVIDENNYRVFTFDNPYDVCESITDWYFYMGLIVFR